MRKSIIYACLFALLVVSCKTLQLSDVPGGSNLMSGAAYVGKLKEEGKLPGVQKDDEGTFRSVPVKTDQITEENDPSRLTILLEVKGKANTLFWYDIERTGQQSEWQLIDAWRTDRKGENRIELLSTNH